MRVGNGIRQYLNFELRANGDQTISKYALALEDGDTYLRLERCGNQVYGLGSVDGLHWRSYEPIKVDFPAKLKAGLEVVNSSKVPFTCTFQGFKLSQTGTNQTGTISLSLLDAKGAAVGTFSQSFPVVGAGNNVLSFALPNALPPGKYSISGQLTVRDGTGQVRPGVYQLPAVPVTLSAGGSPALSTNGFSLVLKGPVGSNYLIEASQDLSSPTNWHPVLYFTATNSPLYFNDPAATNYQQRFYRAVMQ